MVMTVFLLPPLISLCVIADYWWEKKPDRSQQWGISRAESSSGKCYGPDERLEVLSFDTIFIFCQWRR